MYLCNLSSKHKRINSVCWLNYYVQNSRKDLNKKHKAPKFQNINEKNHPTYP